MTNPMLVGGQILLAGGRAILTTPVITDPTATVTVSSRTNLLSTLNSWEADWNGTASSLGIASTDERVIDLEDGSYSGTTFDQNFPQRVTIRSENLMHGADFTGTITLTGNNINLRYLNCGKIVANGASNCDITRSRLIGDIVSNPTPNNGYGIHCYGGSTNILAEENYIAGYKFSMLLQSCQFTGRWNFCDIYRSMPVQTGGTADVTLENECWGGDFRPDSSTHGDWVQARGFDQLTVRWCYGRKATSTGKIMRGIALGDEGIDAKASTLDNCLLITNHTQGFGSDGGDPGDIRGPYTITHCVGLWPTDDPNLGGFTVGISTAHNTGTFTRAYNLLTLADGATASGTGSTQFNVGPDAASRDYSDYGTEYNGTIGLSSSLWDMMPKSASQFHPSNGANTPGPVELYQKWIDGDTHAAKHATVAVPWAAEYNADGKADTIV